MKKNNTEISECKNQFSLRFKFSKPFQPGDICVFVCLAIFVLTLFSILIFPKNNDKSASGFKVIRGGQTILTFIPDDSQPLTVGGDFSELIETQISDGIYRVKIYSSQEKKGYNLLVFNIEEKSVRISDSNCSESRDCVYFPTLKNSGSIYCAPHDLKIAPINGGGYVPPTAG